MITYVIIIIGLLKKVKHTFRHLPLGPLTQYIDRYYIGTICAICRQTYRGQDCATRSGAVSGCYLRRLLRIEILFFRNCRGCWLTKTRKSCPNPYSLFPYLFLMRLCVLLKFTVDADSYSRL